MKMRLVDFTAEGYAQLSGGAWVQPFESMSQEYRDYATGYAWDQWAVMSCVERNGGHHWWLEWSVDDGLWLHCRHCPAGIDELYPDGNELVFASLPVPGMDEPLVIENGMVPLTSLMLYYSGPVTAYVHEEKHYSWEYGGWEYDAWVIVEPS